MGRTRGLACADGALPHHPDRRLGLDALYYAVRCYEGITDLAARRGRTK